MKKIKIIGDNWFTMLLGTAIMAAAIKLIYDPANLVTGGVSGAGIIVKELTGIPLWLTNLAFNIPLFIAALAVKGWKVHPQNAGGYFGALLFPLYTAGYPY